MKTDLVRIAPFDKERMQWRIVIETPKGSHNKYAWDEDLQAFALRRVLPEGMFFPFDFGFIPATKGDDGDPVDVLLLMDHPAFAGCVVPSRLIGVIEAQQTEKDGTSEKNDRLLAVPIKARSLANVRTIKDLPKEQLEEIAEFFANYNRLDGKRFKVRAFAGPQKAEDLVHEAMRRYRPGRRKTS